MNGRSVSASASALPVSNSAPFTPGLTSSGQNPAPEHTATAPEAIASSGVSPNPSVREAAAYAKERLAKLSPETKRFDNPHTYKVGIGRTLMDVRDNLIQRHLKG